MRAPRLAILFLLCLTTATARAERVERADWRDAKRGRTIPVLIRYPAGDPQSPVPVVLVSHGLGGSREGLAYVGQHWAEHGYLVVHLQHPGSDDSVWTNKPPRQRMAAMRAAARDLRNAVDRPADVSFVIDHLLAERERGTALGRLVDPDRIGVAGHSFGAYTALAVGGQRFAAPGAPRHLTDERIKAAIPMSSPVPAQVEPAVTFASIDIPVLHITGTRDTSALSPDTTPADRRKPYDFSPPGQQYLVIFDGADHMVFAGREAALFPGRDASRDPIIQKTIQAITLEFLDAHLKRDEGALARLKAGHLKELVGDAGLVEQK